jgi:hypothetical protein
MSAMEGWDSKEFEKAYDAHAAHLKTVKAEVARQRQEDEFWTKEIQNNSAKIARLVGELEKSNTAIIRLREGLETLRSDIKNDYNKKWNLATIESLLEHDPKPKASCKTCGDSAEVYPGSCPRCDYPLREMSTGLWCEVCAVEFPKVNQPCPDCDKKAPRTENRVYEIPVRVSREAGYDCNEHGKVPVVFLNRDDLMCFECYKSEIEKTVKRLLENIGAEGTPG